MKIAIIHDWLTTYAGAEKTLEQMLLCYPEADLYSVIDFIPSEKRKFLLNKSSKTTFIQKLPFSKRVYRFYLPLMPIAIEQVNLNKYDLIISHSHSIAKGVLTNMNQIHICYCHTPMRYAWHHQFQYIKETNNETGLKRILISFFLHKLRMWDISNSNGVDYFLSNSLNIQKRIYKTYRRNSDVLYPPVDTDYFSIQTKKKDYYVTASRLVPYKKIDEIVKAFAFNSDKNLIVIGKGPDLKKIKKLALKHKNIEIMGYQKMEILKEKLQNAKAFIFAAEEDFGIAPLEAQSCGTPVIAFNQGGSLETVLDKDKSREPTGVFFDQQNAEKISSDQILLALLKIK